MGKQEKLDQRIRNNPNNIKFKDVVQWLKDQGFVLDRTRGSHHLFLHPLTRRRLNFQPDKSGNAKPYQIKQALEAIDGE